MPNYLELTPTLLRHLPQLTPSRRQALWHQLETTNRRLHVLLSRPDPHPPKQDRALLARHLVCQAWSLTPGLLHAPYRYPRLVQARTQLAALLIYHCGFRQHQAARLLARHRTTVSHGMRLHALALTEDAHYAARYRQLEQQLLNLKPLSLAQAA